LSDCRGFKIIYRREEDDTYWKLRCEGVIAYNFITEELSTVGYLIKVPIEGAFLKY
jgi:hypothetical protein